MTGRHGSFIQGMQPLDGLTWHRLFSSEEAKNTYVIESSTEGYGQVFHVATSLTRNGNGDLVDLVARAIIRPEGSKSDYWIDPQYAMLCCFACGWPHKNRWWNRCRKCGRDNPEK